MTNKMWGLTLLFLAIVSATVAGEDPLLKWQVAVGGAVVTSPAVAPGGTIIFGADDRQIHALSPEGNHLWACELPGVPLSPVMASGDGGVYAFTSKKIHRISPRGTLQWSRNLPSDPAVSPLVLSGGGAAVPLSSSVLRVFGLRGDILWEGQGSGSWEALALVQNDRIAAVRGGGVVTLYSSWGEELHTYHLGSAVISFCADGQDLMIAATTGGHLFGLQGEPSMIEIPDDLDVTQSVGRMTGVAGKGLALSPGMLWSLRIDQSPISLVLESSQVIRGISADGTVIRVSIGGVLLETFSLNHTGKNLLWNSDGGWYRYEGTLLEAGRGEDVLWQQQNPRGWSGIVLGPDRLYAGGGDWLLYSYSSSGPPESLWNHPRGSARQNGAVLSSFDPFKLRQLYEERGDYQYLRRLALSSDSSDQLKMLRELESLVNQDDSDRWRNRVPFAPLLLVDLLREVKNPQETPGSYYSAPRADLQSRALILLGKMKAHEMRSYLLQKLRQSDDSVVLRAGVEALALMGSDPEGDTMALYGWLLHRFPRDQELALAVVEALDLLNQSGGFFDGDEAGRILSQLMVQGSSRYLKERAWAVLADL